MNTTERVIREQFPFWDRAPVPPACTDRDTVFVVVGCGTSYHLAQSVAVSFNLRGLRALAVPGGEWSRRRTAYLPDGSRTHVIGLSRSGESTETVETVTTIGPEAMLEGLRLAGVAVGPDVAAAAQDTLQALDRHGPAALRGRSHLVFLGAGALYGIAAEGSIKAQEMSLSHVQTYHPMEYRHGPVSLIDQTSLVALLYSHESRDEEVRIASELQGKGARVIGFGGPGDVELPVGASREVRGLVVLPALQMLGERVAEARGLDSAAPRHLAKVVVLG